MPWQDQRVLTTLWQKCAVGCATVSEDGRFTAVNDRFSEIVEYTPAELVGMHFKEITLPSDAEPDIAMTKQVILGEVDHYRMVKTYIKKSGYPVLIELLVHPIRKSDGTFEFFLAQVIPKVNVTNNTEVTVEPIVVAWRLFLQNKKFLVTAMTIIIAVVGLVVALFEFLGRLVERIPVQTP